MKKKYIWLVVIIVIIIVYFVTTQKKPVVNNNTLIPANKPTVPTGFTGIFNELSSSLGSLFGGKPTSNTTTGSANTSNSVSTYVVQIYNANSNNALMEVCDSNSNYLPGYTVDSNNNILDPNGNIVAGAESYQIITMS